VAVKAGVWGVRHPTVLSDALSNVPPRLTLVGMYLQALRACAAAVRV
jgi:hypothetical protein